MTALVMSQSRQRNVLTHYLKVTCSHRQKTMIYEFIMSFFCYLNSISQQLPKYHYDSEIIRTVTAPSRNEE